MEGVYLQFISRSKVYGIQWGHLTALDALGPDEITCQFQNCRCRLYDGWYLVIVPERINTSNLIDGKWHTQTLLLDIHDFGYRHRRDNNFNLPGISIRNDCIEYLPEWRLN